MFVKGIEISTNYTRSIRSILRNYGSNEVLPGCSTCIVINNQGWLLTCKHVTEGLIRPADVINSKYAHFRADLAGLPTMSANKKKKAIAMLEQKYGYFKSNPCTIQIKNSFDNVVDSFTSINVIECSYADLALADLKQGLSLCRLGFPYPEFTNFQYNSITDDIEWTTTGNPNSPLFPIDGIITRHVAENGQITGLELSTPGLKGQSGGPLFDKQGIICGLQSSTVSLPLGFDQVNREIMIDGKKKKVSNYPFLHLGRCVHVDVIKKFLDEQGIKYQRG